MRTMSFVKIVLLAGAIVLPMGVSAASAKTAPPPPGSCAYGKGFIPTATFCSYSCDGTTQWCLQQGCFSGVSTPAVPCWGTFCTTKCGG
jgi:hypothetical protein